MHRSDLKDVIRTVSGVYQFGLMKRAVSRSLYVSILNIIKDGPMNHIEPVDGGIEMAIHQEFPVR